MLRMEKNAQDTNIQASFLVGNVVDGAFWFVADVLHEGPDGLLSSKDK